MWEANDRQFALANLLPHMGRCGKQTIDNFAFAKKLPLRHPSSQHLAFRGPRVSAGARSGTQTDAAVLGRKDSQAHLLSVFLLVWNASF